MPPDSQNLCARNLSFDSGRIVDEVGLAQTHAYDAPPRQRRTQSSGNRFNFGQFRHGSTNRPAGSRSILSNFACPNFELRILRKGDSWRRNDSRHAQDFGVLFFCKRANRQPRIFQEFNFAEQLVIPQLR